MNIYAVCLLFQFKTELNNKVNKRRVCEERIYHINCNNAEDAYQKAINIGKNEEFYYMKDKKKVYFEFIGIIDLIELSELEEKNVVWSRYIEKVTPMERKDKIIPPKDKLTVFKSSKYKIKLH